MQLYDRAYILWASVFISCRINLPRGCYCRRKTGATLLNNDGLGDFENMAPELSDRMFRFVLCCLFMRFGGCCCSSLLLIFVSQVLCEKFKAGKGNEIAVIRKNNTNDRLDFFNMNYTHWKALISPCLLLVWVAGKQYWNGTKCMYFRQLYFVLCLYFHFLLLYTFTPLHFGGKYCTFYSDTNGLTVVTGHSAFLLLILWVYFSDKPVLSLKAILCNVWKN